MARNAHSAMEAAAARPQGMRPTPGLTALDTSKVRTTLTLDRDTNTDLGLWITTERGTTRLSERDLNKSTVLRVLIELLTSDEEIAEKVRKEIRRSART